MKSPYGQQLAVTGVGVVSPWGDGPGPAHAARGAALPGNGDWFDHRDRLGPRGYKYLPAAAQYALAAARAALADGGRPDAVPDHRRGLLLATNAGLAGLFDTMDATVAEDGGAARLSPATAPYFAVNVLGNRLAAELGLKGFALTVANERTAAVDALATGALALAAGRCDTLLMAAAEEPPPGGRGEQGATALALEPLAAARARGAGVHALVAARSLFLPPRALESPAGRDGAVNRLAEVLAAVPGPRTVHLDLDGSAVSETVALAVARAAAGRTVPPPGGATAEPRRTQPLSPHRGAGCLGPAFAVAHAVTTAREEDRIVVTADGAGHVALVRISSAPAHHTQESQHAETA